MTALNGLDNRGSERRLSWDWNGFLRRHGRYVIREGHHGDRFRMISVTQD